MRVSYILAQCLLLLLTCHMCLSGQDFYELLGVSRQATTRDIRKAFKKLALTEHPDKKQDDPEAHENFLRINRAYEVLKDDELRKKYDTYGEEGLKEDAPSGRGYQSWNFYKQEFGIYDNDEEVVTLSKSDFEQSVENTADVWFVNFYSPQCSHCHELAPAWREVARELDGVVRIGAINCHDDWMLCRSQGIRSYPSLIMYPQREKYHGERSRKALVKYVLQQVNAKVHELWLQNYDRVMSENNNKPWLITFCGDGGDCLEQSTLRKLSVMLGELVNVGQLDCHNSEALCENLGIDHGTHYFSAGEVEKRKNMEITSLDTKEVAFAVLEQLPDMTSLDAETFQKILKSRDSDWLIEFVESDERNLELRKLPALLPGYNVGRIDCRTHRTLCNDIYVFKPPSFVLFKKNGAHEVHHGRVNAHDIAAFAREVSQSSVSTLGPSDFPARVVERGNPWIVDFYAPWCPPCMRLLPEFRKASKQMNSVSFGTVDCTLHNNLCHQYNIRSYPTTVFYNKSEPHHYHGHHSAGGIVEFLEDTLRPPVIDLTPDTFGDSVERRSDKEMWLVDFFAPWCGPCQQLAPEWRKLAKMMLDEPTIKVAHVDCQKHRALCQNQGVSSYPSIRLYPVGKGTHTFHTYNGWFRDAQNIHAWAYEYMPSATKDLTNTFTSEVLYDSDPWIVDFYAPWCGHCQVFAPELDKVAKKLEGRVKVGKVNCDANGHSCQRAGIRAYPTVRFYPGAKSNRQQNIYGEEINSQSSHEILQFINSRVSSNYKIKSHQKDEL